jgi:thiol-disulfide isomerase/thioredoxin
MKNAVIPVLAAGLILLVYGGVVAEKQLLADAGAAPALTVSKWVKGEPVIIADGKGKDVYVVEFWATWCPPCRESIPHLTELQKKYKDANVVVVGITDEDIDPVKSFVATMGDKMNYHVAVDKDQKTYEAFNKVAAFDAIPTAFVIDKTGKVVWQGHPMAGLDDVLKRLTSAPKAAGTF